MRSARPLFSIVILTYGVNKKQLFRCLKSVEKSNYQNKEVVLIANGSPLSLVATVKKKFPKIRIIRLPNNTGVFFGFNVGFANAQGQYILALDDDATIFPETINKFVSIFNRESRQVMVISPNAYNPQTKHFYSPPNPQDMISFHGISAFRKEVFSQVGYYDSTFFLSLGADDLALRIINHGGKIYFAKDILLYHFEDSHGLRKKQIFFNARNKVWFNIKHFSWFFIPLIILRDLTWLSLLPYRKKSLRAIWYGLLGYTSGYLTFWIPLKKRKTILPEIQRKFVKFYLFSDVQRLARSLKIR